MAERTVLLSPMEVDDASDIGRVGAKKRDACRVWLPAPKFGDFIRGCRGAANLSLRKAAQRVGISHTYLAQIEQGEGASPLGLGLYDRLADAYEIDDRLVLERAGCRYAVAEQVADRLVDLEEARMEGLWLDELYRPRGFTEDQLGLVTPSLRKYLIELVQRVDISAREGGPRVLDRMDAWRRR